MENRVRIEVGLPGERLYNRSEPIKSYSMSFLDAYRLEAIQRFDNMSDLFKLYSDLLDINVYDMYWEDIVYYSHWLRNISFPFSNLTMSGCCPSCKEDITVPFAIEDLQYKTVEPDVESIINIKLYSNETVSLKIQQVKESCIIQFMKEELNLPLKFLTLCFKRENEKEFLCDKFYKMNNNTFEKFNLQKKDQEEFVKLYYDNISFLSSLSAEDYSLMQEATKKLSFGVEKYIIKTCPHCLKEVRLELQTENPTWFLSKVDIGQPIQGRVFFAKKPKTTTK
jgi:hypothetical protein